jgi:hypothetical protein
MPNPSTTQVVEFSEQIALADDAGGVNRDRMWALALFWAEVMAISVGRDLVGCKPDLICVGEPANNRGLECQFPVVELPDTVLDACQVCLIIDGEDDARLRPN